MTSFWMSSDRASPSNVGRAMRSALCSRGQGAFRKGGQRQLRGCASDEPKGQATDRVHAGHVLVRAEEADGAVVAAVGLHALEAARTRDERAVA